MNHTLHLYRLQLIDSALEKAEKEIASLQAKIDSDKRIQQAKSEVEAQMNRQYKKETALKSTESIIQDFNVKLEINQSSLYSGKVRSPKELQDLQLEAESIRRSIAQNEDTQFEQLMQLEESTKVLHSLQESLLATTGLVHREFSKDSARIRTLQNEIKQRTTERVPASAQVPSDVLNLYEELKSRKRGVAVSVIEDGSCNRCGAPITSAERQKVKTSDEFVYCPSCGRILYAA